MRSPPCTDTRPACATIAARPRVAAFAAGVAFACAGAGVLAWPAVALGQGPQPGGSLDQIVLQYRNAMPAIEASLSSAALVLFGILALIEFTYAGIRLAFRGAEFGEWVAELVNQVLFIGFFLSLLLNSGAWATAIVTSFRQAGSQASIAAGGAGNMTPSNVAGIGIELAGNVADQMTLLSPGLSFAYVLCAVVILICFAFIALFMIEALVQSYVVISAGALFMGFGGSRWTKDFALKVLIAAVGVGAKLFVLQLLVGLGQSLMNGWLANGPTTFQGICVMVAVSLVMLGLTKSVPDLVQSLINGTAFSGSGGLLGAAAAAGGAAGAAAGYVAGGGHALAGAARLASEQLQSQTAAGGGPGSRLGHFAALTGGTARNLGAAALSDVGARLGGRAHHGNMPGRMGEAMHSEARGVHADRERAAANGQNGAGPNGPLPNGSGPNGSGPNGSGPNGTQGPPPNTIGPAGSR